MASNHEGYDIGIHVDTNELEKSNQLVSAFNDLLQKAGSKLSELHSNPELTSSMKGLSSATSDYVGKLKSSSDAYSTTQAKSDNYRQSIDKLGSAQQSLETKLSDTADKSNKLSEAYSTTRHKANDAATSVSEFKSKLAGTDSALQAHASGLDKISSKEAGLRIKTDETTSAFGKLHSAGSKIASMGMSIAAGLAPIGIAFMAASKRATDLQNQYLTIRNLMQTGGDSVGLARSEQRIMEQRNRELSDQYGVSQKELGSGSENLIRRGYSGKQEIASHPYFLQAAMASGDAYNDVVNYGAPVLEGFGYKTKAGDSRKKMAEYTKRVLNQMAYVSDLSATDFSGMGNAMRMVSQTAHSNKISMAGTLAALGVESNNGLDGTIAGTGLRKDINSLVSPSMKGQQGQALKNMGLTQQSFLKNGHLESLPRIFETLNRATRNETSAQRSANFHKLFGSSGQESALVLQKNYRQIGSLSDKANDASSYNHGKGYIDTLSRKNMASFSNQYKIFKTNLSNVMTDVAKYLMPTMAHMLKSVNGVLEAFKKLPAPMKKSIGLSAAGLGMAGSAYVGSHVLKSGLHMIGIGGGATKAGSHSGMLSSVLNATKSGGALQSIRSAGGLGGLSTMGKFATGAAGAGVALSSGLDLFSAIKAKNPVKKFHKYGNAIGGALGGGVGLFFGGPAGAAVGATVGKVVGGWAGDAVRKFSKSKMGKRIGKEMQPAVKVMGGIGKQIGKNWNTTVKGIRKPLASAWSYMSKGFGQAMRGIGKSLATFNRVTKPFQRVLETVFVHYLGTVMRVSGHVFGGAFKAAGIVITGFARGIGDLVHIVGSSFALISDLVHGNWSGAWKDAKNIFSGVVHYFSDALNTLKGLFKDVFGTIGHVVKDVWGGITGAVSGISHALGGGKHIKAHAAGGAITSTHMALVGEQGPELEYRKYGTNARLLGANGPEITKVRSGNHILNARDTNRVLHGGLGAGLMLRGYASGTDKLSKQTTTDYKTISDKSAKSLQTFAKTSTSVWNKVHSNTAKNTKSIKTGSIADFTGMRNSVTKTNNNLSRDTISTVTGMTKGMIKQSDLMQDGVVGNAKDMAKGFGNAIGKLRGYARSAMSDTIDQLNKGIGGIDKVLDQFGGNSQVIKPVKFAAGTNGQLPHDTLAMVNDATSGPRQEAVLRGNNMYLPRGDNRVMPLKKGDQVLNGYQLNQVAHSWGLSHFAKGSGVSKSALRKIIERGLSKPKASFQQMFTSNLHDPHTDIAKDTTELAKRSTSQLGNSWMGAIWQVLSDAMGGAAGKGGSREAFLKYAESNFTGVPYQMGAMSRNLADCSGMVAMALRHFGLSIGRTTTAMQSSSGTQYLGKSLSKTIPGDLAIFGHGDGAAGHVGIIKNPATGTMFNETPPRATVSSIANDEGMGYGFYRVNGLRNGSDKKAKHSNSLLALAKKELGKSALSWVKKNLSEDLDVGSFNIGGDVGTRARILAKALESADPRATKSGIAAILGNWEFESGLNPSATNPGGGASGLGQWLGGRLANLKAYARRKGKSWTSPAAQLEFALRGDGSDSSVLRRILESNGSVESLASQFSTEWERGGYTGQHVAGARTIRKALGYAKGGTPRVGNTVVVGEHGPELAKFEQPVHVYSNDDSKKIDFGKLLGKSKHHARPQKSAPTINININGNISSEKTATKYAEIIEQKLNAIFNNIGDEFGGDPSVY